MKIKAIIVVIFTVLFIVIITKESQAISAWDVMSAILQVIN